MSDDDEGIRMSLSATTVAARPMINPDSFYEANNLKELTIAVSPQSFGRGQRKAVKAALKAALCSGEIVPVHGPNGEVGYASKKSSFTRLFPTPTGETIASKLGADAQKLTELVGASA